jgi:hypothetical protein
MYYTFINQLSNITLIVIYYEIRHYTTNVKHTPKNRILSSIRFQTKYMFTCHQEFIFIIELLRKDIRDYVIHLSSNIRGSFRICLLISDWWSDPLHSMFSFT